MSVKDVIEQPASANRGWFQRFVSRLRENAKIPTNNPGTGMPILCADCGQPIGKDCGPKDGWQLEDGRTVCHACCVADTRRIVMQTIKAATTPFTHAKQFAK